MNQGNRLDSLSCDDPNPPALSVSTSSFSLSSQTHPTSANTAKQETNSTCTRVITWNTISNAGIAACDPAEISCTGRETSTDNKKKRRKGGQTGNVPVPVRSPRAAGVIRVARVGRLGVHSSAVRSWLLARGLGSDRRVAERVSCQQRSGGGRGCYRDGPQESAATDNYPR